MIILEDDVCGAAELHCLMGIRAFIILSIQMISFRVHKIIIETPLCIMQCSSTVHQTLHPLILSYNSKKVSRKCNHWLNFSCTET